MGRNLLTLGQPFDLASRADNFRILLETLPVAAYATDASGLITSFNKALADLAGRTPEIGSRPMVCHVARILA
jgi:PAS domain-containing protein